MVRRKPAGRDPYAGEWAVSSKLPPTRNLLPPRHTADLNEQLNRARQDLRDGNTDAAVNSARDILSEVERKLRLPNAKTSLLHALSGAASTVLGIAESNPDHFLDAVEDFTRAGEVVARRGDLTADFGIALANANETERASRWLVSAINLGEDNPDVRRTHAEVLRDLGQHEAALDAFDTLIDRAPYDWQAQAARAELMETTKGNRRSTAEAWLSALSALLAAGRIDGALDAAAKVRSLSPELTTDAELALADALIDDGRATDALNRLAVALDAARTTEQRLSAAELLIKLGEFDRAETVVTAIRAEDPDDVEALILHAQLLLNVSRVDEARRLVDRLGKIAKDDLRTHILAGGLALAADEPFLAIASLSEADRLAPGQPFVLSHLGAAFARAEYLGTAMEFLDQALSLDPDDAWAHLLRGRAFLDLGEVASADADVRAALVREPRNAEAHALLGELLCRASRFAEAKAELETSISLEPEVPWVWTTLGEALAGLGEWAEAQYWYRKTLDRSPRDVMALIGLANALLSAGEADQLGEAERAVTLALEADPANAVGHALLGEVLRRRRKFEAALSQLDKAVELLPEYAYAIGTRGEVLLALKRFSEAIKDMERSVELGVEISWIRGHLVEAYLARYAATAKKRYFNEAVELAEAGLKESPRDPHLLIGMGQALQLQGKHRESVRLLTQAIEGCGEQSGLAGAHRLRGRAHLGLGDAASAVADFEQALALGGDQPDDRALLATAKRLAGDLPGASEEADAVLAVQPANVPALNARGAAHAQAGRFGDAESDLKRALELAPGNHETHHQLRKLLERVGRQDEAAAILADAIRRTPEDVDLLKEYTQALAAAGDTREALSLLDDLLWRSPGDPDVLRLLGNTLSGAGRHEEAVAAYTRGIELAPGNTTLTMNLSFALSQAGRFEEALAALARLEDTSETLTARADIFADMGLWERAVDAATQAIDLGSPDLSTYLQLGWALQHGEAANPTRSIEVYAHAVELAPRDPWPRKGLANAYYLTGKPDLATEHYEWVVRALAGISPREAFLNSLRGWCLYRLQRYLEAVDCFQRAVDERQIRAGVLFDLMLAHLGVDEEREAQLTYQAAVTELGNLDQARRFAVATVGLDNLRTAVQHDLADRPEAGLRLLGLLTDLLASPL